MCSLPQYAGIEIRDISSEKESEQYRILNNIINSERMREYDPSKEKLLYFHVIKCASDEFVSVVSVYTELVGSNRLKSIFDKVFRFYEVHYSSSTGVDTSNEAASRRFWKMLFEDVVVSDAWSLNRGFEFDVDEVFDIPDELSAKMFEAQREAPDAFKARVSVAVGKILCKTFNTTRIIAEEVHDFGKLSRNPLCITEQIPPYELIVRIEEYLHGVSQNDLIDFDSLDELCEGEIKRNVRYSQHFVSDRTYNALLDRMKRGILYKVPPREFSDVPFRISYLLFDDNIRIEYAYDSSCFEHISMQQIHESICKSIANYLNNVFTDAAVLEHNQKLHDISNKILDAKIKFISKSELFADLSQEEIRKLAIECRINHRLVQQTVMNEGTAADTLYMILSGNIEIDGIDSRNFIHPLSLLKAGDYFGIECLLNDNLAKANYVVQSNDALVLSVPASRLKKECEKHPTVALSILEEQSKRLAKFQKLWMMS